MARIRSIHPGLFTDEAWVSTSPLARLLAIGLWTEADDQGVFEWKPLRLKMRLFPLDTADIGELLAELEGADLIRRFTIGPAQVGAVRNFRRFQRPKKPNALFIISDEIAIYVGLKPSSSPPVGNRYGTGGGNSPQMEDGGWREEPSPGDSKSGSEGSEGTARAEVIPITSRSA